MNLEQKFNRSTKVVLAKPSDKEFVEKINIERD